MVSGQLFFNSSQQLTTIHAGHAHIRYHQIHRNGIQFGERCCAAVDKLHFPVCPVFVQACTQPVQQITIIINKQDAFHQNASVVLPLFPLIGKHSVNFVPAPIVLLVRISPPCFSIMIERVIANPWPVPRPTSLVVKNGS